jgi:hypothetical protein
MVRDDDDYAPVVEYTYVVEGTSYCGKNLQTVRTHAIWDGPKRRVLDQFPLHATVDVFYDPAKPSRSVLKPGGDARSTPFLYLMGVIFLAAAYAAFRH